MRARAPFAACLFALLAAVPPGVLAQSPAVAPPRARQAPAPPRTTDSVEALKGQAAAAFEANRLEEAAALYVKALRLEPGWIEGRWYLGTTYYELGRYADAREAFGAVVTAQPKNGAAWAFRGLSRFQLADLEAALVDLMKARDLGFAGNVGLAGTARYHTGILMTRFGQFDFALKVLTEFAVQGNDSPSVIEALGLAMLRMPVLPSEAPADAREAIELAGRGAYMIGARQPDPARTAFSSLVERFSALPNTHYAYGVYLLKSEPDEAIAQFKAEVARAPGHVPALLQLAAEYTRRSDAGAAKPWAAQAVDAAPADPQARLVYGQVLLDGGEVESAILQLEQAVSLLPENPASHFALARAYQKSGRAADAERERAEFTRLDRAQRAAEAGSQSVGGAGAAPPE